MQLAPPSPPSPPPCHARPHPLHPPPPPTCPKGFPCPVGDFFLQRSPAVSHPRVSRQLESLSGK
eukprot:763820-Hanusia_phi.AAC.1